MNAKEAKEAAIAAHTLEGVLNEIDWRSKEGHVSLLRTGSFSDELVKQLEALGYHVIQHFATDCVEVSWRVA